MDDKTKLFIRNAVADAAQDHQKLATFHYYVLIHAGSLHIKDATEFCRIIGVKDSYAIEYRKMLRLSKIISELGYHT